MTLSKKTIDYLASSGYTFEEINHVKNGLKDIENWNVVSFENVIKNIKNGNAVNYV